MGRQVRAVELGAKANSTGVRVHATCTRRPQPCDSPNGADGVVTIAFINPHPQPVVLCLLRAGVARLGGGGRCCSGVDGSSR